MENFVCALVGSWILSQAFAVDKVLSKLYTMQFLDGFTDFASSLGCTYNRSMEKGAVKRSGQGAFSWPLGSPIE